MIRRSVRFRLTATVALAAAIVFGVGAFLIVGMVQDAVVAEARTADRAFLQVLAATHDPDLSASPSDFSEDDTPQYAIGTADGEIVFATPGFPTDLDATPGFDIRVETTQSDGGGREYVLTRITADSPDGEIILIAARPLDEVGRRVADLRAALFFVVPALVAAAGATSWVLTGRALRPVFALTERASEISHDNLGERLPVPATNDEISHLAVTLNDLLARTQRAALQQQQFVADASHELRSPVTAINGHLHLARTNPATTDWEQLVSVVETENARLAELITDLVDLARLDEHPRPPATEVVDLDDLILANLALIHHLDVDLGYLSAGQVPGDKRLLESLIRNTIDNAARHASKRVAITLTTSDTEIIYAVDDDGPGIPTADRQRIFDRFVRLDTARSRDQGGTGLGLAIARAVAKAHDATISATDSRLGGARIEVRFPANPPDRAGDHTTSVAQAGTP